MKPLNGENVDYIKISEQVDSDEGISDIERDLCSARRSLDKAVDHIQI